ncbi:MAG: 3',5'-cyclic-nucleotide phosphodiesterase [Nitrospinota bacterium]
MEIKVLGCYGGNAPGQHLTSFLINNRILVDAGSVTSALTLKEQTDIDVIILTHSHLDHVLGIPFLADNINGRKKNTVDIVSVNDVIEPVKEHILNDRIWPDFTQIPHTVSPILRFKIIEEDTETMINGLKIRPVKVSHSIPTVGYIIADESGAIAYTGDTGPTKKIWERIRQEKNLKFIITEVSYPNNMKKLAEISRHLTTEMLKEEIKKIDLPNIPIYIYHLKPPFIEEIKSEIAQLPNVTVLRQGDVYKF